MDRPLRNPELTMKALNFIFKHGRNTLDKYARRKSKAELIAEGWIKDVPENLIGDWI